MSVYLFTALFYFLVLLTCGTLFCGNVCASAEAQPSPAAATYSVELFKKEKITGAQKPDGTSRAEDVYVNDYHSPVLVSTNKVLVALAGVNRTGTDNKNITVLTNYFVTKGDEDWGANFFTTGSGDGGWKEQLAAYDKCEGGCDGEGGTSVVRGLAAAVKEDKIYIFLANVSTKAENSLLNNELKWRFWLLVNDADTKGADKPIKWEEREKKLGLTGIDERHKDIFKKELSNPHLLDCSAFVTEEKKFLFIVKSKLKDESTTGGGSNNEKNITVFFQYDESDQNNLKLLDVESTEGLHPTFFEWDGKILKTPTDDKTERSKNNMMEFSVNGKKFKETNNTIASLQKFLKDKKYFVNATIQEKGTVLLFTQQNYGATQNEVYLWMYDGTRVSKVGTMVTNTKKNFYASLLYTKNELFVLYQTYKEGAKQESKKIYLTRLKAELESIKNILDAWKHNDDNIKNGCKDTNKKNGFCSFPLPIDGLVGFLNTIVVEGTITTWKDEYYYTNATVIKGNNSENGLKFAGAGAGAQWLVGEQSTNQAYKFTDPGFTLLATVHIDKTNKQGDNSLLGLVFHGQARRIGLWCNNEKWAVNTEENKMKYSTLECKQEKPYIVTFVLNDGTFFVYVDGDKLTGLNEEIKFQIEKTETIDYFYFGADIGAQNLQLTESYATATNAFLYKRPFIDTEIKELKKYVKTIEDTTNPKEIENNTKSNNDQPTSTQLPSRTEDGGVGGGVRVFSLLLPLLCVSAPLLHP